MNIKFPTRWLSSVALLASTIVGLVLGCAREQQPLPIVDLAPSEYVGGDPGEGKLARIRYSDGLVSPNDKCMVRQVKLNLRVPPIYVNGLPMGFC